ncbi:GNAT family N-acetyltransferase [Streptomyces sp. HSW2009]|uniref:GNAT family N-acetyltransferase n=1 Tax=Streptomyces sp. HSW2009 TaxID=3142890 RepID=UPI0032EAACCC
MDSSEFLTAADVRLMQGLAQRIVPLRPDLVNADASYGELAWNWGRAHAWRSPSWRRRLWFADSELVAWGWAHLPFQAERNDGSVANVTGAYLAYQVHPEHQELVDEVIEWYDEVAAGLERTVLPGAADEFGLARWAAHGYVPDQEALGDDGSWTQLNERDLTDLPSPELPAGYRFRTADEVTPEAVVQAHVAAWTPTKYTVEGYEDLRNTPPYRGDLHVLVEAADGTMAASAIMWFDEVNATVEFEPVGTHPDHRRRGLAEAVMLHGMRLAQAAGARHATVVCLGAPGHRAARELYYGVGFREASRDAPLIKTVE